VGGRARPGVAGTEITHAQSYNPARAIARGYLSSQVSSIRHPLKMLFTIIVSPLT
jgi:hypothetical protein